MIFDDLSKDNLTSIGWIDSNELSSLLVQSTFTLSLLKRDKYRFHPSIFILIGIVLLSMLIGNEYYRLNTTKYPFTIGICLLFIGFYFLDRYLTNFMTTIYLGSFFSLAILTLYICFSSLENLLININSTIIRISSLCLSTILIVVWFYYRLTLIGYLFTNLLVFLSSILLISQMRIRNLTIGLIIYICLILFECLMLIQRKETTNEKKLMNILTGNLVE